MIRVIDDTFFGEMDLEYFAAYGTLLGLIRNDHIIPWTADNDFVVRFDTAKEIWKQHDYLQDNFGLRIFNGFYFRACPPESFMEGTLAKWKTKEFDVALVKMGWTNFFPYVDFFYGMWTQRVGSLLMSKGVALACLHTVLQLG